MADDRDKNVYTETGIALVIAGLLGFPFYLAVSAFIPRYVLEFALFWGLVTVGLVVWSYGNSQPAAIPE